MNWINEPKDYLGDGPFFIDENETRKKLEKELFGCSLLSIKDSNDWAIKQIVTYLLTCSDEDIHKIVLGIKFLFAGFESDKAKTERAIYLVECFSNLKKFENLESFIRQWKQYKKIS